MRLQIKRLAVAGAAAVGAITVALLPGNSFAAYSSCRADPTVTLSNGVQVTLWASINADISQVKGVYYTLHVPKGVTVKSVAYDSSGYLEHLTVTADQTAGHYAENATTYLTSGSTTYSANAIRQDGTTATKTAITGSTISLSWCT